MRNYIRATDVQRLRHCAARTYKVADDEMGKVRLEIRKLRRKYKNALRVALDALTLRLSCEVYHSFSYHKLIDTIKAPSFTSSWLARSSLARLTQYQDGGSASPHRVNIATPI